MEERNENGDKKILKLHPGYDRKTMYLCHDGLSIDLHKSFCKKLMKLPIGFMMAFKQSMVFQKVLFRVVKILGPLHMAFHMLQCIYTVFKNLLVLSQKCLQWRKIKV
jgi:hypothetical protein